MVKAMDEKLIHEMALAIAQAEYQTHLKEHPLPLTYADATRFRTFIRSYFQARNHLEDQYRALSPDELV
jgi:hypothetical protein